MKQIDLGIIQKLFMFTALAAFFFVTVFGARYFVGMQMNSKGEMARCIFNTQPGPCPMTITQHIGLLQEMFVATPGTIGTFGLLLLLISFAFLALIFVDRFRLLLFRNIDSRQKLYLKQHWSFLSPLQEAFSQGILNPKIYEFVAV
jgi:hypothetical protein